MRLPSAGSGDCNGRPASTLQRSAAVLVRGLYPEEGLQVDHVAQPQVARISPRGFGEVQQAGVDLPGRRD
jgi:hypothetical protein